MQCFHLLVFLLTRVFFPLFFILLLFLSSLLFLCSSAFLSLSFLIFWSRSSLLWWVKKSSKSFLSSLAYSSPVSVVSVRKIFPMTWSSSCSATSSPVWVGLDTTKLMLSIRVAEIRRKFISSLLESQWVAGRRSLFYIEAEASQYRAV